jgi:hypothetical protein
MGSKRDGVPVEWAKHGVHPHAQVRVAERTGTLDPEVPRYKRRMKKNRPWKIRETLGKLGNPLLDALKPFVWSYETQRARDQAFATMVRNAQASVHRVLRATFEKMDP